MKTADNEEIQLIWDEINVLSPEEREEEYSALEKRQPDIFQFLHEELEGLDQVYFERAVQWLYFYTRAIQVLYRRKAKLPKIDLHSLHITIENVQDEVGPSEVDEYCENKHNALLSHILDLISHLEEEKPRSSSTVIEGEEEIAESELEDSYDSHEYDDYDIEDKEEEGDDDYVIFRELYDEHEDGEYDDEELSDHEYAQYVIFLMFKTIMDVVDVKLERARESQKLRALKKVESQKLQTVQSKKEEEGKDRKRTRGKSKSAKTKQGKSQSQRGKQVKSKSQRMRKAKK